MLRLFTLREYKKGPLVQPVTYFENKINAKKTRIGGQVVSFGPDHKKISRRAYFEYQGCDVGLPNHHSAHHPDTCHTNIDP
jgi:hypothetical protein